MVDGSDPRAETPDQPGGLPGSSRWHQLSCSQRVVLVAAYVAAYVGPAYYMVTPGDFEWYERAGLFAPWAVLELAVSRLWPPLRDLMPGCLLGMAGLFLGCLGAMLGGAVLLGPDRERVWVRIAISTVAACLAAWFTSAAYRATGREAPESPKPAEPGAAPDRGRKGGPGR